MGQQQLLLIILGVIVVGIAIAVGLSLFSAQSIQANKDAMINDINNIAAYCYQYRIRPTSMAGGGGTYTPTGAGVTQLSLPAKLASNDNATYQLQDVQDSYVVILGVSKQNVDGTVQATLSSLGTMYGWTFGSYFTD